jgi:hypothetical protein
VLAKLFQKVMPRSRRYTTEFAKITELIQVKLGRETSKTESDEVTMDTVRKDANKLQGRTAEINTRRSSRK